MPIKEVDIALHLHLDVGFVLKHAYKANIGIGIYKRWASDNSEVLLEGASRPLCISGVPYKHRLRYLD